MKSVLKNFCLVIVTIAFALSVTSLKAQTVTITELVGPQTSTRWQQFSTAFSATATGLPAVQQECKLTSTTPTWKWSLGTATPAQPGFNISPANDTCFLSSNTPGQPEAGAFIKGGGYYTVTVTATASWKDDHGNVYVSPPGTGTTTFFVIVPKLMQATPASNLKIVGPPEWGHETYFHMKLLDNEQPANPYRQGTVREAFSNIQYNPIYRANLISSGFAPGIPASGFTPPFDDKNAANDIGWTNPPPADTGDTTLWYQFAQTFHCMETAPGYPNNSYDTTLNTYTIYHQQGTALRQ